MKSYSVLNKNYLSVINREIGRKLFELIFFSDLTREKVKDLREIAASFPGINLLAVAIEWML